MVEPRQMGLVGRPPDGMAFLAAVDEDAGAYMTVPGGSARAVHEPEPGGGVGRGSIDPAAAEAGRSAGGPGRDRPPGPHARPGPGERDGRTAGAAS
ncbi:hypothetical protein GCM10010466_25810 [Planomonospora alba]|uniref:Uncharacterized protein n=1 Tax=Planomonospora alba TaxID=161354 RepID=A0ABP6N2Q4_9ACTN